MRAFKPKNYKPAKKSKGKDNFNYATGSTYSKSDGHRGGKPTFKGPKILQGLQTSTAIRHIDDHPFVEKIQSIGGLVTYHQMPGLNATVVNQYPKNTNPGVATNITLGEGLIGKCFNFDGSSSSVQLSNTTFPSTDFSVVLLAKRNGTQDVNGRLVDYGASGPNGGFNITWLAANVNKLNFGIYNAAVQVSSISTDSELSDNSWYLLVGTYTSNSAKFYLNGVQQGVTDTSVTITAPAAQSVTIGRRSAAASNYTKGSVQHLAIYNTVLAQADITTLATLAGF